MALWSCTTSEEQHVRLWLPKLLKDGWPAVRKALLQGAKAKIQNLTSDQVAVSLAAALIVAAALTKPDPEMPAALADWIAQNRSTLDPSLRPLALCALDRAEAHFSPDWAESDEEFGYQTAANELRLILGRPSRHLLRDAPET